MKYSGVQTRAPLLIAALTATLIMMAWSITTMPSSRSRSIDSPTVLASFTFPSTDASRYDHLLVSLEQAFDDLPSVRSMAFLSNAHEAGIIVVFERGTDPNVALSTVQGQISALKRDLPTILMEHEKIVLNDPAVARLLYVTLKSPDAQDHSRVSRDCREELLPELERIRGLQGVAILGNEQPALEVDLNLDRLRDEGITVDDVAQGMTPSSMIGPRRPVRPSPTRVGEKLVLIPIFRGLRGEQYDNIVLKANAEGEIVRLKDVGEVKLVRLQYSRHGAYSIDGPPSAVLALRLQPNANSNVVAEEVRQRLTQRQKTSFPTGMTFEISHQLPTAWSLPRHELPTSGR